LGVTACGLSGAARADDLQNQVLAAARATRADIYAFRRTLVIERSGQPRKVLVEHFDPARAAAEQWSLVSVDAHAPTAKELADARKAKRGPVPSYGEVAKWFGAPATRSDTAPGYATYRFARLPKGALQIGSHDASADTQAEALVDIKGKVPFVERVRLSSTKGFSMMLVASVKSMTIAGQYRLLPDGHAVPAGSSSDMTGSFLGKAGAMRVGVTYSDFQVRGGAR
jgi:hypothetical protein